MNRNSMNQKRWNEEVVDGRRAQDIEEQMERLALSYVPEWHFNREDPDIGSVLAKIFARQMEGNIERCNQVLQRYHTEFVNMLGISLLPARPAQSIVVMDLVQDTVPGVEIPRGTKLLAQTGGEEEEQTIFETSNSLYVTNASLTCAFMTETADGRIVPLKGSFEKQKIVDAPEEAPEAAEAAEGAEGTETAAGGLLTAAAQEEEEEQNAFQPFRLYDSGMEGIQINALLIYHMTALDIENDHIYVRMKGSPELMERIGSGDFRFYYDTKEGLLPVESVETLPDGETVALKKEQKNRKGGPDGDGYSLLVLKAETPVKDRISLTELALASSGREAAAEFVNNGVTDYDTDSFDPFGDTLSLFQECYIGHDTYFSKAGAVVTLRFRVSYPEHRMTLGGPEEDTSLRIVKRKPRVVWTAAVAEARAEEIAFEYYNGIGWKKLNCMTEVRRLFAEDNQGSYEISFVCPDDWRAVEAGAYEGRCIRMQLLKSDNCYMRPGIHHYPHVENLTISFTYEGHYVPPQRLESIAGTRRLDLTKRVMEQQRFAAFSKSEYDDDALYLGFDRRMESGPVSLLFQMEEGVRFDEVRCRFEYSTAKGFKQMKILDYTADMSRSGVVMFVPQADMHAVTLEGKRAYWIRIVRMEKGRPLKRAALPIIRAIYLNAVNVVNVETREEEDYYLEESVSGMQVNLGVPHILDTEVWVNETGSLSRPQMQQLLAEAPERVRAEYDILGEISSFYVKWEEADQLENPPSRRCYLLDRMNSAIIFGDGLKVMIPTVTTDVAFKAKIRCCSGKEGNVDAMRISEPFGNLMFVERIYNPVKAYGGSSIEDLDSALLRGANILKSRHRLVSEEDYLQEILSYSDTIDKVSCVTGETVHGEKIDSAVSFVILLKDFAAGSYSFHGIAGALKRHLLETCELTVSPGDLHIVEPVFARVSVDVWVEVPQMDDSFEIQNLLQETLENYLNPVGTDRGPGWEIGALPKRSQLLMKLNVLKSKAVIKKMVVTVRYADQDGEHEADLEDMKPSPFLSCCSGVHHVNIMLSGK